MRRIGDRFDGKQIRNIDSMHFVMPIIYPNRCDNEAYISEMIDLTAVQKYLDKKNKNNEGYHYNTFQVIVTAVLKTLVLRPKMNRFIANKTMYQRDELSAAFTVKKQFKDSAEEGLAFVRAKRSDTIDDIHKKIEKQIFTARTEKGDSTTQVMDVFNKKIPHIISKNLITAFCKLEKHGLIPKSFVTNDPYYSSVVLTNLGSIRLKSGYHHLTNWGTNSVFIAIGEIKERPFTDKNGKVTAKLSVDLGLTIDERIADGYYYSKTVKLLKYLIEHPEQLETSLDSRPRR
ncbi:MAG: 2-oxo acid dehydrogenase subunit E2 [Eubacterium sp.]|nr:2-oxo acid dehydrogenase subunit E2 [Eubacterium sp.]